MNNVFKQNMKGLLDPSIIITIATLLIIGVVLHMFFTSKISNFRGEYKIKYFIYLISLLLIFAFAAFLGQSKLVTELSGEFKLYQSIVFILGIIHFIAYRSYFNKFEKENLWIETLFNLMIGVFTTIPFILVYAYLNGIVYVFYITTALLFFLIPTWIYSTFKKAISIPAKIHATWAFPSQGSYPNPREDEFKDIVIITFVFYKNPNSSVRTEFRVKCPIRMDFGRLFYHFANDYNAQNPDSPIELTNKEGKPEQWVFYLKPAWYGVSKYIDPKLPIYVNGIAENSVIVCLQIAAKEPKKSERIEGMQDITIMN